MKRAGIFVEDRKGVLAFIEHPLFLTAIGIACGLLGLALYTPVLAVCGICVLLALHRSRIVASTGLLVQFAVYAGVACVVAVVLWEMNVVLAEQSRRVAVEIANLVSERINRPDKEQSESGAHAVDGGSVNTERKAVREAGKSHARASSAETRDKTRAPMVTVAVAPTPATPQPESLPLPRVITLAQLNADIEQKIKACEGRLDADAPCNGGDLSKCSDKKLLEWGKPLLDHVEYIFNELQLDSKIARSYSGGKFIKAMDAGNNDAADKYRQCCAADALRYFKELAQRTGGGKENFEFYTWSEQLLSPVKSKEWKSARSHADTNISVADIDLRDLSQELDAKIRRRCIDTSFPKN